MAIQPLEYRPASTVWRELGMSDATGCRRHVDGSLPYFVMARKRYIADDVASAYIAKLISSTVADAGRRAALLAQIDGAA